MSTQRVVDESDPNGLKGGDGTAMNARLRAVEATNATPNMRIISSSHNEMVRTCSACGAEPSTTMLLCSACLTVAYCNTTCQKVGWKGGHKAQCKAYVHAVAEAAAGGNASALADQSIKYLVKPGEENAARGFTSLLRAAEADNSLLSATYNLALMYEQGRGCEQDLALSLKWMLISATDYPNRRGHADAAFILGEKYREGEGVAIDLKKAIGWFAAAAESPSAAPDLIIDATYNQSMLLRRTFDRACIPLLIKLATEPTNHVSAKAANDLSIIFQENIVVERSREMSLKWLRRAAELGHEVARKNLACGPRVAPPSENEVKAMSLSMLRTFIANFPGNDTKGCIEKADFVALALSLREKRPPFSLVPPNLWHADE